MVREVLGLPPGYVVAALMAALGTLAAALGIASTVRWRFLDKRIREYVSVAAETPPPLVTGAAARGAAPEATARRRLSQGLHRRLTGTSVAARIQARLVQAGSSRRASDVMVLQGILAFLGVCAALLLGARLDLLVRLLLLVLFGAGGAMAPLLWLGMRANGRRTAFERQLPQAIDAMAASLQAGSTLSQAMAVLAREMPPPLSEEFRRVLRETEVGLAFPDALAGLLTRVPSSDLMLFISSISIQQRVGGDLAVIFRTISHTIRERLRVRGEMKVLTAQARYSSYIVGGLPLLLFAFMWVTNYTYLSGLFQPGLTRVLLYMGIVGVILGFFSMNKLSQVDV